jgi:hypothetical protein
VPCFAECLALLRTALDIDALCRVPDKRHSAKRLDIRNVPVSVVCRVVEYR